jgi:hypothetical protein
MTRQACPATREDVDAASEEKDAKTGSADAPARPDAGGDVSTGPDTSTVPDASTNDVHSPPDASVEATVDRFEVVDRSEAATDGADASKTWVDVAEAAPPDVQGEGDAPIDPLGCWNEPRKSNVLVLNFNPYLVSYGMTLRLKVADWNDPEFISVRMAEHVRTSSHGLVNYNIVEFRELAAWPKQLPGAAPVDEMSYFHGPPPGNYVTYEGGNADYADIFATQNICSYVRDHDISEIWLWGAAGDYVDFGFDLVSYRFAGDRAPPGLDPALYTRRKRNIPDCGRSLLVMGFTYTFGFDPRGYSMRAEELLRASLRGFVPEAGGEDPFTKFSHYAREGTGDVEVGNPAYPPNGGLGLDGDGAWDYGNTTVVMSAAEDWYSYPALTGATKPIDCHAWSCSNEGYQAWYEAHFPHFAGGSPDHGCSNWWKYVADLDGRLASCTGDACLPQYGKGRSCTSDDQCGSRHCSCQNSRMVCSDAAGPACPNDNWLPCVVDSDCRSGVCGCNDGPPPKVCLPTPDYPRTCNSP